MTQILLALLLLTALVLALVALVIGVRRAIAPSGPARITLNDRLHIETQAGGKLLPALLAEDVLLPSACGGKGTCGLCRVQVSQGGGAITPTEESLLSAADRRAGIRLACQVPLRGEMAVVVSEDMVGAETHLATVAEARMLTPLIREVVIQLPDGLRPEIVAGSFVQVTAPPYGLRLSTLEVPDDYADVWETIRPLSVTSEEPVTRAYSISNRPEDTEAGRVVLQIRLALPPPDVPGAPPGIVSSWLFSVKPGDAVEISGPFGSFRAQDTDREMILIGGGVGMAPLRAIVLDELLRKKSGRKISFWYGARSRREMIHDAEFRALAREHRNFRWEVALSEPDPDWRGQAGFIHSVVAREYLDGHPAPEDCEYYLCGPPLMIRAVLAMLEDAGVERDTIFHDDFGV